MQQKLSYVDNKLRIMGDIFNHLDLKKTQDASETYIFICLLISDEMIFFNFIESTFVDAYININKQEHATAKEPIHKLIYIMVKICKLKSFLSRHKGNKQNHKE